MTQRPATQFAADFFARLKTECIPRIEKVTVPFYGIQDDQVKRDRTGILYKVAGNHFILTASHYLRPIIQNKIPLYIDRTDSGTLPIPLADALFHTTEEEGRDVAAIKLPDDVADQVLATKEFLTHSEVKLSAKDADSLYILFGYPKDWSSMGTESSILSNPLAYATRRYEAERDPHALFDPNVHVVLEFSQTAMSLTDQRTAELPHLRGVSGSGIWSVAQLSNEGLRTWRPEHLSLVAIQHRWFRQRRYIQGTWIGYALALVQDNYPDVRAAMNLAYVRG